MCGIYGWQWRKDQIPSASNRMILASALGTFNDQRGGDSWGWYSLMTGFFNKGLGDVAKDARFAAFHDSIMCHTRKATVGVVSLENSHPWKFGPIIGAQNGAVYNHKELNEKRAPEDQLAVDSMHIFDSLAFSPFSLKGLRGYGALEFIDERHGKDKINLVKTTTSGDLAIAVINQGVIWSSNISHLRVAMRMSGIGKPESTFEAEAEVVYRIEAGRVFKTTTKMAFDQYVSSGTVYGSQMGWQGGSFSPNNRPTHSEEDEEPFRVTKSIRKTIGRTVAKLPKGVSAYICADCYKEVDEQKKCPRGHSGGVLVVKEAEATGPVAKS